MVTHTDVEVAKAFLPHMLTPIFYITDDSTIRSDQIGKCRLLPLKGFVQSVTNAGPLHILTEELKGLATEVQTLIQQKVGATTFAQVYSGIRQRALAKRRERKTAKLMTVSPHFSAAVEEALYSFASRRSLLQTISRREAAAQRKSKVNARKHDSRKRKAQHQAYVLQDAF